MWGKCVRTHFLSVCTFVKWNRFPRYEKINTSKQSCFARWLQLFHINHYSTIILAFFWVTLVGIGSNMFQYLASITNELLCVTHICTEKYHIDRHTHKRSHFNLYNLKAFSAYILSELIASQSVKDTFHHSWVSCVTWAFTSSIYFKSTALKNMCYWFITQCSQVEKLVHLKLCLLLQKMCHLWEIWVLRDFGSTAKNNLSSNFFLIFCIFYYFCDGLSVILCFSQFTFNNSAWIKYEFMANISARPSMSWSFR